MVKLVIFQELGGVWTPCPTHSSGSAHVWEFSFLNKENEFNDEQEKVYIV